MLSHPERACRESAELTNSPTRRTRGRPAAARAPAAAVGHDTLPLQSAPVNYFEFLIRLSRLQPGVFPSSSCTRVQVSLLMP